MVRLGKRLETIKKDHASQHVTEAELELRRLITKQVSH